MPSLNLRPLNHPLNAAFALALVAWAPLAAAQSTGFGLPRLSLPELSYPALRPAPATLPAVPPPPAAEQGERLADLLARTLPREPQVRGAMALRDAADERRLQARSRLGPAAYLQVNGGQGRETEFGVPLSRTTDRVEAGLRWNLYNAGNDMAELNGTERDLAAAAQEVRRAREDSAERIAESYVELLFVQAQLGPAAERLAAVRQLAAQVQQQTDAGRASAADATQAQASVVDAEISHEQLLADQASARAKLAALVGTPVGQVLPVVLQAVPPTLMQTSVPGLVDAARLRAVAARERVRPVASLLAPRIDLEVRQRLSDRTDPVLTTEQKSNWQITARWEFPVMGESLSRRNEGQRRAEAAEAEAERVARSVQADLQALDARIAIAERAVAQLDKQIAQYNQLLRAGELQFDAGRRSVQTLIQLRDSRFNVEQRRAEQANRLLAARMRQLALTGQLLPALGLGG